MRAASARRRAATAAVSTGRPMTGSSGIGVHAPSGAGAGGPWAGAGAVMPNTKKSAMRMGSEAIAPLERRQRLDAPSGGATNYAMTVPSAPTSADAKRLTTRVAELERERKHLLAVVEILKELSTSLHFTDILQTIARKLGEAFGLDRCSIFLAERGGESVRLVASYEDPTIRNYVVDLERYPELKRAMQSGETVFIADAATDPSLKHVKGEFISPRVGEVASSRGRAPRSSTAWSPSRWRSSRKKPRLGEGRRPRRGAAPDPRAGEPRLLRTRQAGDVGWRVRPAVPRAAGARSPASRAPHAGQPHPPHRRRARGGVPEAPSPRADAVARQRLQRGGARRMGRAECAARPRGQAGRLQPGGEDRRRRGEPDLRRRGVRHRRHAGERRRGGGHHGQPAHRARPPAPVARQALAPEDGSAGRGLSLQVPVREAEPGARGGGGAAVREPPQRRRRGAAPARPQDHPSPGAPHLLLPH